MARLIDADDLEDRIRKLYCEECKVNKRDYDGTRCSRACTAGDMLGDIKDAPTVDPIKHGHWNMLKLAVGINLRECSVCGNYDNKSTAVRGHYCWYCGSQMDEVIDDGKTD